MPRRQNLLHLVYLVLKEHFILLDLINFHNQVASQKLLNQGCCLVLPLFLDCSHFFSHYTMSKVSLQPYTGSDLCLVPFKSFLTPPHFLNFQSGLLLNLTQLGLMHGG